MMNAKAAQAFALSTSSISTLSLTPFLYQTRTLCRVNSSRSYRQQNSSVYSRRLFSSISRGQYAADDKSVPQPTSTFTEDHTTWSPLLPTATVEANSSDTTDTNKRSVWPQDEENRHRNTTSRRDGVYVKGVFHRIGKAPIRKEYSETYHEDFLSAVEPRSIDFEEEMDDTYLDYATKSIDFDEKIDEEHLANKDEIADLTRSHPLGESTITDTERYAFQKVFRDIFGKNQGSQHGFSGLSLPMDNMKAKSKGRAVSAPPRSSNLLRHEMEDMVRRYPAPLRAAAARAIGLTEAEAEGEEEVAEEEPEIDMQKVEALRQPERDRVETLMKAAQTDFELWKVMEKEVFSLIPSLGLQDVEQPIAQPKEIKSRSRKGKKPSETKSPSPEHLEKLQKFSVDQDGISPLALYGPLYPSYLLLGLRLLDRSFAKSSPLTLTLLPQIKSMGLISHVLGASSQLYNELLQIHRYRYDDYRGILQLLEEMEYSGIEFDNETLDIVQDIQRAQVSARKGDKGPAIQTLWSLPEFAPNKFKVWYDKIAGDVKSRAMAQRTTIRY